MRVIGIDPGLRRLGWGVVDVSGSKLAHVGNGACASNPKQTLGERLADLFRQLSAVLEAFAPEQAAVEQTFVNKDAVGTLKLGQARGVAMLVPALTGMIVEEYAPNAVKKTLVGVGHAQKEQVQHMVKALLPGVEIDGPDAADALAIAICHAYQAGARSRLRAAEQRMAAR